MIETNILYLSRWGIKENTESTRTSDSKYNDYL